MLGSAKASYRWCVSEQSLSVEVSTLARELHARPRDFGTWWRLAETLAQLGADKDSREAYADLGQSASEVGAVGLAVACVLRLRGAKDARSAEVLLERISKTHCKGSGRVDPKLRRVPPAPPAEDATEPGPEPTSDRLAAIKAAHAAMQAAGKAARARAPQKLPPTPLVGVLDAKELRSLIEVMTLESYARGDVVVDVGEPAASLYWIARGTAEVSRGDKLLGELQSNSFFGEIALVGSTTRTARVACIEPSHILCIPSQAVVELAGREPRLAKMLASYARSRLLANVMKTSELFQRLSHDERASLLPKFEVKHFAAGETLIGRGKENDSLYVLVSGHCEVQDDGGVVAALNVGDGVGEMSMLGRKPATFDVVATRDTLALGVTRDQFDEIAMAHPGLLAEVYKLLVERERENSDALIHDADDLII